MGEPTEIYVCTQSHFPDAGQGHGRWHGCQWCSPMMVTVIKFKHCYTPPKLISFGSSKQRAQDGDVEDPFIVKGCCDNDTWPGVPCCHLGKLSPSACGDVCFMCILILNVHRANLWDRGPLKSFDFFFWARWEVQYEISSRNKTCFCHYQMSFNSI